MVGAYEARPPGLYVLCGGIGYAPVVVSSSLFAGVMGCYKNSSSHCTVDLGDPV